MVRARRVQVSAAVGTSSVVVPGVLGEYRPQMPLTEDQQPVGDLGPDGEHNPFREGVSRGDVPVGSGPVGAENLVRGSVLDPPG